MKKISIFVKDFFYSKMKLKINMETMAKLSIQQDIRMVNPIDYTEWRKSLVDSIDTMDKLDE